MPDGEEGYGEKWSKVKDWEVLVEKDGNKVSLRWNLEGKYKRGDGQKWPDPWGGEAIAGGN